LLALDRQGRLFVADRSNNRIQIFDQDGKFVDAWTQFGRPGGLFIDQQDTLYVADSHSRLRTWRAPESLAADDQGNVFGGFIEMQTLKKYVAQPFFRGRPGWVRSRAWIWDFSSTLRTTAWAGRIDIQADDRGPWQRTSDRWKA
jgi:sugar lactone lactonase YvrE